MKKTMLATLLALTSATALAGSKWYYNVAVYTSASEIRAVGDLATVRNSPDSTQYIFCEIQAWSTGTSQVMCAANTIGNTSVYCYSMNEELKKVVAGITPNSLINFAVDPASPTTCTRISVRAGSVFAVN